jgi:hypothetical protein
MRNKILEKMMTKHLKIIFRGLSDAKCAWIQNSSFIVIPSRRVRGSNTIIKKFGKMILTDLNTYEKIEEACILLYDFGNIRAIDARNFFRNIENKNDRLLKKAWKLVKETEMWRKATVDEILDL